MSFSSDIKEELCSLDNLSPCCYHAQVYGLVLFAHFNKFNFSITTEHQCVFDLYNKALTEYLGLIPNINKMKKMTSFIEDDSSKRKAFKKFGHSFDETTSRINYANITEDCCISSFLRGVFLSCGSVSDPSKTYHLEFVVPFKKLSLDLMTIMGELDLRPKSVVRKGNNIIYFKDSESIEDFLAYIGAQNASLYLMNVKIEKDVNNRINRKMNFEMCNIDKTINAAMKQIEAIEYLKSTVGLGILPEGLQKLAKLRLKNPEASLSELESLYDGISRSGIKHRLDKIVSIADELKEQK